jgi:murein peptide amidase A
MIFKTTLFTILLFTTSLNASGLFTKDKMPEGTKVWSAKDINKLCNQNFSKMIDPLTKKQRKRVCRYAKTLDKCKSVNGKPIIHFNRRGFSKTGKRILALSLIHGDELSSGTVSAKWIERLHKLRPRSKWRVIPVANPDGWLKKSRLNANKVDINRNFPSKDWDRLALKWWETKKKKNPRRYPGPSAASEPETRCLMAQINDFKPDFIISIHTPLGVLDFDGPRVVPPKNLPLPWRSLGNYPGSLGRYMWKDKKIPVLTIELQGSHGVEELEKFDRLQDLSGTVAIRAHKILKKKARN